MARKQYRCGNRWCNNLAHSLIDGKYYCKTCKPVKVKKAAAEEVDIMSDIHIRHGKIMPLEIKNIGPGCTCEPEKKGWWQRFLNYFKSDSKPDCC